MSTHAVIWTAALLPAEVLRMVALPPLHARLKRLRKKATLTQEALAAEAGASLASIRGFEQNTRYPSLAMLEKLAAVLGADVYDYPEYKLARARELLDERTVGLKDALRYLEAFDAATLRLAEKAAEREAQRLAANQPPGVATDPASGTPVAQEPES